MDRDITVELKGVVRAEFKRAFFERKVQVVHWKIQVEDWNVVSAVEITLGLNGALARCI